MARSVIRLEEEEVRFFHINYIYLWKKLNTAPYYVNGNGEFPNWIKAPELLPSYVNLSKCMNLEHVPSMNIVNKIVQFYNANITPEITTFQFLHERLEETDSSRHTSGGLSNSKFEGLYYGYYYSGHPSKKEVYGMLIKTQEINGVQTVQMIAGISDLNELTSMRLQSLFDGKDLSYEAFKKYKNSLDLSKRKITLYKGIFAVAQNSVFFKMQGIDREDNWLFYNCVAAGNSNEENFLGGIGLLTFINGQYDLQFLKMGIERADLKGIKPFQFDDPRLRSILEITKQTNEHVHMSLQEGTVWNDLIIENAQ